MSNEFFDRLQSSPMALAGIAIASGDSVSDALTQGATQARQFEQDKINRAQQARDLQLKQILPDLMRRIDPADPQGSVNTLISAGMPVESALKIVGDVAKMQQAQQQQEALSGIFGGNAGGSPDPSALIKAGVLTGNKDLISAGIAFAGLASSERGFEAGRSDKEFDRAQSLNKDFAKDSQDYVNMKNSYQTMLDAASDPSGAGDISLTISYMKVLDPGSVVREGEFATAENAAGVSQKVRNLYNRVTSGERLSPKAREQFLDQAANMFNRQAKAQKARIKQYSKRAEKFGLTPDQVIIDYGTVVAPGGELDRNPTIAEEAASIDETIADGGSVLQKSVQEGVTATNPQTGERIIFRNGTWEPVR